MEANFNIPSEELNDLDMQIEKTVQDLGRLSSFSQNQSGDALFKVRMDKMKALRFLREKRIRILKQRRFS